MPDTTTFSKDALRIDAPAAVAEIERAIRTQLSSLRRRGIVVGLSGGIDSSVVTCLAARAVGPERVFVLFMPERDSSSESLLLGRLLTEKFGIPSVVEELAPTLGAAGCYSRQVEAIRTVFPESDETYKCQLSLPPILDGERLHVS